MKVLNYGSLNIDYVYEVDHFVMKGETLSSSNMYKNAGGKGLNQSIALRRAGIDVYHAGMIGEDGIFLENILKSEKINTSFLQKSKTVPTGNAIIQNELSGDNCIILYGGANCSILKEDIDKTFEMFGEGDYIILQNEINEMPYIVEKASQKKMKIALNPTPINENIMKIGLKNIDFLILNEIETTFFIKEKINEKNIEKLKNIFPKAEIIITLGEKGAICLTKERTIVQNPYKVKPVDTTGAGDTFIGYYMAHRIKGIDIKTSMDIASKAAAISITKKGAASSIPTKEELNNFIF